MYYQIVIYILGMILKVEAGLLLLPFVTGLVYREHQAWSFLVMAVACFILGTLLSFKKPKKFIFYAREGNAAVALSWILISICGALPFVINGDIPNFSNALFETISGFTTTGASILEDVESLSHASLMWRSFTHWVGGMGVIVFMLAIVPVTSSYNMQLMKAESPGPSVGKLVPRVKESAKILYLIYFAMTIVEFIMLALVRMPVFDAMCLTFGTAGTGGFGVLNNSIGGYSMLQQGIITVFMILFGVNFNAYYLMLGKNKKEVFKIDEVRWYLIIIGASVAAITLNLALAGGYFSSVFECFHHAAFQVGSIITTTGYSTVDFDAWPMFSRSILVLLMFVGACAGSTGGGIKVSRILILFRSVKQEIFHQIHPKGVSCIRIDGRRADHDMVHGVNIYLATYTFIFVASMMVLCMDPSKTLETNFTAVAATINNIGPGLSAVGPSANFNHMNMLSKYVLMFDMLAGRLELYPMLLAVMPSVWKKN